MGCDGVKLLEGKPSMRRAFPIPDFDAPAWEPFWAFAEKTRLPLLWHVNDPEQYWDPSAVSAYAKSSGWGYGADDVNNEAQYAQVRAVLQEHPAELAAYVGTYPLMPSFSLQVSERDGRLYAQATGQGAFALEAAASDVFEAPAFGIEIRFLRGDDGTVQSLQLHQAGQVLNGVREH